MARSGHAGHLYQFFDFSVKYYVVGRAAFFLPGYVPPSANLFHHAFEYLFKYGWLSAEIDSHYGGDPPLQTPAERQAFVAFMDGVQERMANTLSHNLTAIWPPFKNATAATSLNQFDAFIPELQKWEALRYPWFPAGARQMQTFVRKADRSSSSGSIAVDEYELCLEEMDELYTASFLAAGLNPGILRGRLLRGPSGDAYDRENYHKLCLLS